MRTRSKACLRVDLDYSRIVRCTNFLISVKKLLLLYSFEFFSLGFGPWWPWGKSISLCTDRVARTPQVPTRKSSTIVWSTSRKYFQWFQSTNPANPKQIMASIVATFNPRTSNLGTISFEAQTLEKWMKYSKLQKMCCTSAFLLFTRESSFPTCYYSTADFEGLNLSHNWSIWSSLVSTFSRVVKISKHRITLIFGTTS